VGFVEALFLVLLLFLFGAGVLGGSGAEMLGLFGVMYVVSFPWWNDLRFLSPRELGLAGQCLVSY